MEELQISWLRLQCGVLGALLSVGLTAGGQSLPELALTSLLPEENQDSLQDSQLEYFWLFELTASHFFTSPGLLSYHSPGGSGTMFSGGRGRLTEPGLRSKLTSFS